jgi:ABC-type multidrug transport system fused ATPase/permease subunit
MGMSLGYWLGILFSIMWGSYRLSTGMISFGTVTVFIQLIGQVQGPFMALARSLPQFVQSAASADRISEINLWPEEKSEENKVNVKTGIGVRFDNVSAEYINGKPVLENINVNINPGEMIGIAGPTGEGKTTFVRLALSLIKPKAGSVHIYTDDGRDLLLDSTTRCCFSYVPQGNSIISGSVADNLRLGNPDATDEEMYAALKDACALEFVEKLPDGVNAAIGEKGASLSEGQAQRIAIARAFLHNAPVLLFDEASSALDADTERKIIDALKNKRKTCIFISHRPAVFEKCERIFKISNCEMTEIRNRKVLSAKIAFNI